MLSSDLEHWLHRARSGTFAKIWKGGGINRWQTVTASAADVGYPVARCQRGPVASATGKAGDRRTQLLTILS
jgi:hypothetical protein